MGQHDASWRADRQISPVDRSQELINFASCILNIAGQCCGSGRISASLGRIRIRPTKIPTSRTGSLVISYTGEKKNKVDLIANFVLNSFLFSQQKVESLKVQNKDDIYIQTKSVKVIVKSHGARDPFYRLLASSLFLFHTVNYYWICAAVHI